MPEQQKLCECGCGGLAPIAKMTQRKDGSVQGQPQRFIRGHARKIHPSKMDSIFWSKVDKKEAYECWEWMGSKTVYGYGRIKFNHKTYPAHRFSFILSGGVLTEEKDCVCHHCDNRSCVNPNHLFAGSMQDNSSDMVGKGRQIKGERHVSAKLKIKDIMWIRRMYGYMTQKSMGSILGVTPRTIMLIATRQRWKHVL